MTDPAPIIWYFPLPRPHTGVPLGNGTMGLLFWGDETLRVTISRAGFWDRRNGQDIPAGTTFEGVRRALTTEDDAALAALFPPRATDAPFPQQMGGGRLEISFPDGLRPLDATLDLATGGLKIRIGRNHDDEALKFLCIAQAHEDEICWIEGDALTDTRIDLIPAHGLVCENAMAALGIPVPLPWTSADGGGFEQRLPDDQPLAVAFRRDTQRIVVATALGYDATDAVRQRLNKFDFDACEKARLDYWVGFWRSVARVSLPDPVLQRQFDLGLYKQAGLIRRHAPAATLQGPWMEDTTIPPWSNDYHFNINVQFVYGAALVTGQASEMQPLWDMLRGWMPRLRALGEGFYRTPGAMILPHAVDDRCQLMGSFWAGTIDQACVAWMGRMAYQYYEVTGDETFLDDLVWPLLVGTFEGYFAMLEETTGDDGRKVYHLPISVSPEFGGSDRQKCWGRDASFQLAALHSTIHLLGSAASVLGKPNDPRWADVAEHLPLYSLVDAVDGGYGWIGQPAKRIALWEGKDLAESHRHHSHLAAIYPFCNIDPFDPTHRPIVARSINRWNTLGAGNWTGWCLPWASILCSRCGLADAATSWLHLLAEQFTNEGHATLHNANAAGVFAWDDGSLAWPDHRKGPDFHFYEIMQMDAAMGAISAVIEVIVSVRNGVIHIADRLPTGWRELSFDRLRMPGGFVVSGHFSDGMADELSIVSTRGGTLRISPALGKNWTLDDRTVHETVALLPTVSGQTLLLRPIAS